MVGSMPYSLEKGPYLAVMEDFVNGSAGRMKQLLRDLRADKSIAALGGFKSKTIAGGPLDLAGLIDHSNEHWFGWKKDSTGKWQKQAPFDEATNRQTGFWNEYYGDVEGVLRETLIRGIEVALGLQHGEEPQGRSTPRRWHIEAFWRCPIPWFEGWVTWRQHGNDHRAGQVTLLISTPGHGTPLNNTPLRTGQRPGYAEDPPGPVTSSQGMWVVSQEVHKAHVRQLSLSSGPGQWTLPTQGLGWESQGSVRVVAPPEDEGGVLDPPRQWIL